MLLRKFGWVDTSSTVSSGSTVINLRDDVRESPGPRRSLWPTLMSYFSLGKPRVVGLLLPVTAISYVVSTDGAVVAATLALLMAVGALSAGGAAIVNNYLERGADALMYRTRTRPLAAGTIAHPKLVLWFGVGFVIAGTLVGLLISPLVALMLGTGAVFYVLIYTTLLKRRAHWSVVGGGISGSSAVLAGWFAGAPVSLVAMLVGLLLFTWQTAHFWPLALARSDDYERAGIPMLPAVVGSQHAAIFIFLASLATAGISLALGLAANLGPLYLAGSVAVTGLWLGVNGELLFDTSQRMAWCAFRVSGIYLATIFLLLLLDVALAT